MHENLSAPAWSADTIRTLVVPQCAPPYDDEPEPGNDSRPVPAAGATGSARAPLSRADSPGERDPDSRSRRPHEHDGDPPGGQRGAGDWPGQFAQILAETLAGSRPAHQLAPWTTEEARRRIRQLGQTLATGQRPRVRRLMTSAPASGVLELTAVVGFGPRVRVLAVRLERQHSGPAHWRCTAIESA